MHCRCVALSCITLQSYSSKELFHCVTTSCILATFDVCYNIFILYKTSFVVPSADGMTVGLLNLPAWLLQQEVFEQDHIMLLQISLGSHKLWSCLSCQMFGMT